MRRVAVRRFIHHCQCDRTPLRPTDMHTRANMTLPLNRNTTTTHLCGQMQMQDFASVGVCVCVCVCVCVWECKALFKGLVHIKRKSRHYLFNLMSFQTYMRTKAAFFFHTMKVKTDWDYEVPKSIIKSGHMTCASSTLKQYNSFQYLKYNN